jgi:BirA family biotin operon repressor/biotin-[acetyl-CoA-carboxylase] ligase
MGDLGAALPALIAARWPGRDVRVLEEVGSTNDVVKEAARAGAPPGLVVVADRQSAGRGRAGRAWHSPTGAGLYLSTLVPAPPVPTRVPLACAVATHEALRGLAPGAGLHVKWPNDVLADEGRKLAGILCEGLGRTIVVGIGVNVAHVAFPADLAATAVSLRMLGASADRAGVALALLEALDAWLERARADWPAVRAAWRQASQTLGRPVRVGGVAGTAVDLDDDGALLVDTAAGRRRVVAGDLEEPPGTGD